MDPGHEKALRDNRVQLVKSLQIAPIINHFEETDLLSKEVKNQIQQCQLQRDQNNTFLDQLEKMGSSAFGQFLEALKKNGFHRDLFDTLEKTKPFKEQLVAHVRNSHLLQMTKIPHIPWDETDTMHIDKVYVNLGMRQGTKGNKEFKPIHSFDDLFRDLENDNGPKRILVQAKAGLGKTTLVSKIAVEWAHNNPTHPNLCQFEVVFVIGLRHVVGDNSLTHNIIDQLFGKFSYFESDLLDFLKANQSSCLLILDGYDEYSNSSSDINDVINYKIFPKLSVLITTRPWKAEYLETKKRCNIYAQITGFSSGNVEKYIEHFFTNIDSSTSCLAHIRNQEMEDFVTTPLILLFFCLLWDEHQNDSDFQFPKKYSDFYKRIIELIETRSDIKLNQETSLKLGEIALNALLSDDKSLVFKKQDILDADDKMLDKSVFQTGLLSQSRTLKELLPVTMVSFPHKTVQEYFAAMFLVHKCETTGDDDIMDQFTSMEEMEDFQYVFLFACGMSKMATQTILTYASTFARQWEEDLHLLDTQPKHINPILDFCMLCLNEFAGFDDTHSLPKKLQGMSDALLFLKYIVFIDDYTVDPKWYSILEDLLEIPMVQSTVQEVIFGNHFLQIINPQDIIQQLQQIKRIGLLYNFVFGSNSYNCPEYMYECQFWEELPASTLQEIKLINRVEPPYPPYLLETPTMYIHRFKQLTTLYIAMHSSEAVEMPWEELMKELEHLPHLQSLTLEGLYLDTQAVSCLAESLRQSGTHLHHLDLIGTWLDGSSEAFGSLLTYLQECVNMKSFTFIVEKEEETILNETNFLLLKAALSKMKILCTLSLNDCSGAFSYEANVLEGVNPQLESLTLMYNHQECCLNHLTKALPSFQTLKSLELIHNALYEVDDNKVIELFDSLSCLSQLTTLDMSYIWSGHMSSQTCSTITD